MKWKIRRGDGERYTRFIAAFCAALMVLMAGLLTVFSSMVRAQDYTVSMDEGTSDYFAEVGGERIQCYPVTWEEYGDVQWELYSASSPEGDTYYSEDFSTAYLPASGGTVTLRTSGHALVTDTGTAYPMTDYYFRYVDGTYTYLTFDIPAGVTGMIIVEATAYYAADAPDGNRVAQVAEDSSLRDDPRYDDHYYFYQRTSGDRQGYFDVLPVLRFSDGELSLSDVTLDNQENIYEYPDGTLILAPGSVITTGYLITQIDYLNEDSGNLGTEPVSPASGTIEFSEDTLFETYSNSRVWFVDLTLKEGYTVSFDPGEGTGTMPDVAVEQNSSYTLPACTFTPPDGYTFAGWEWDMSPGEIIPEGGSLEISQNTTFTAIWEPLPSLTIYFYSGLDDGQVMETSAPATLYVLPDCTFTPPAGMRFAAWQQLTTSSDFPVEYPAGAEIDLGTFIADVVEFEAVWEDASEEPDEPDYPSVPDGSGGSSGGATEEIRVDNQLNLPGNSSDTILWPLDTTEKNGTSTTTIRDEELQALIDLAQKHEADAENLDGDGFKEGIILIEDLKATSKNNTYILNITEKQFDILVAEDWDRLTLATPAGNFGLYGSALEELENRTDKGDVSFQLDRLTHEGRPGLDATLLVDGKAVTGFEEPYGIQLMVPHTPASGEDVNAVAVDYLPDNGEPVPVTECYYDENKEGVVLHSSHLSKFGVVYRPATFTDVTASHWANPYVTFLTARGVLTASDGSAFRPDDAVTRGETLELFARALSAAKLPANPVQVYSDIPTSSSVARAASWAYYNNLSGSIANGSSYRPNESITREDMAALLGDISTGVGLRLRSKGLDTGYNDMNEIAGYAQNSVKRLRAAGILEMPSSYRFYPDSTLTRGELAQILSLLLSNI